MSATAHPSPAPTQRGGFVVFGSKAHQGAHKAHAVKAQVSAKAHKAHNPHGRESRL